MDWKPASSYHGKVLIKQVQLMTEWIDKPSLSKGNFKISKQDFPIHQCLDEKTPQHSGQITPSTSSLMKKRNFMSSCTCESEPSEFLASVDSGCDFLGASIMNGHFTLKYHTMKMLGN